MREVSTMMANQKSTDISELKKEFRRHCCEIKPFDENSSKYNNLYQIRVEEMKK